MAGNAHLFLLHLPIGLILAVVLLEFWTWRDAAGRALVTKVLAANAVCAVLTAAAGLVLAADGGYPETALGRHRWAGVACALIAVLAWWLRARHGVKAGRAGIALLVVATGVAGHLGATLTHGDGLLAWSTTPRPPAVIAGTQAVAEPVAGSGTEVHPLLVRSCVECHGQDKQKGRLQLDSLAAAKMGGRSGRAAVVPGDAAGSEIMRRVGLPRTDDKAMPPDDHPPLSVAEKSELAEWINGLAAR